MGLWERFKNWIFGKQEQEAEGQEIEISPEVEEVRKQVRQEYPRQEVKQDYKVEQVYQPKQRTYVKKSTPTIKSYEERIDGDKANKYNFIINKETGYLAENADEYISNYGILLKGKVQDKKLFNDLIKNREILLRKRISMRVRFQGEKEGDIAIADMVGILPEDIGIIREYFIGKVIYNDLGQHLNGFKEEMDRMGKNLIDAVETLRPREKMTITSINGTTSFN